MVKNCNKCNTIKDINEFGKDKSRKSGFAYCCKECRRNRQKKRYNNNVEFMRAKQRKYNINNPRALRGYKLKQQFGITLEQYDKMFAFQGGVCAICGCPETASRNGKTLSLAVDHNHVTDKIRGLLCGHCNIALGLLNENPVIIKSLLKYITKND